MSIQSEIDRINGEVSSQNALIQQIKTALQGKVVEEGTIVDTADATATENDLLEGVTAYTNGRKITGTHICESAEPEIKTTTKKLSAQDTSISFAGLTAEPKMFTVTPIGTMTVSNSSRYVTCVLYDGTTTHGVYMYRTSSNATSYYSNGYFSWTYSSGTLTIKTSSSSNGGYFSATPTYQLVYMV